MPQTSPLTGANSHTAIDHMPVEKFFLGGVRHIDEVPPELAEDLSRAYSTALNRANTQVESPTNEEEQTRALKWKMALRHVLLRVVKRGKPGSRQFSGALKTRFQL